MAGRTLEAHSGHPLPPGRQRVTLYEKATGAAVTVWPVDARELVASGAYSETAPAPAEAPAAPVVEEHAAATDVGGWKPAKPAKGKRAD